MTRSIATLSVCSRQPLNTFSYYLCIKQHTDEYQNPAVWRKVVQVPPSSFIPVVSFDLIWLEPPNGFVLQEREKREIFKLLHKIFICKEFLRIRGSLWSRMIQPTHAHLQKVFSINIGTKETKSDPKNARGTRTYATKHPQELKISWIILIGPNFSQWLWQLFKPLSLFLKRDL